MQIGEAARSFYAHRCQQTDDGAAADDGEMLYIVALSSGVDHLPAQLQKYVKNTEYLRDAFADGWAATAITRQSFFSISLPQNKRAESARCCTCFMKWVRILTRLPAGPDIYGCYLSQL